MVLLIAEPGKQPSRAGAVSNLETASRRHARKLGQERFKQMETYSFNLLNKLLRMDWKTSGSSVLLRVAVNASFADTK